MANLVLKNNASGGKTSVTADNFVGNASTASKWLTARTLTLAGDASGSVSIDGSGNMTLSVTVANDSHTHAWANITGKPSTFAPSSHTHSYLPLSGGTITGGLDLSQGVTLLNGTDLNLKAPSGSSDSGDIVFKDGSGNEVGRIWMNSGILSTRNSASDSAKIILHSGNCSNYISGGVKDYSNGVSTYFGYSTSGMSSCDWLAAWDASVSGQYRLRAIQPGALSVKYATSAGSASSASSAGAIYSTGFGSGNFTYLQTSGDFYGSTGWSHYLICNHGDGASYYNYVIKLGFWGAPQYKRQTGSTSSVTEWHTMHTTENVLV